MKKLISLFLTISLVFGLAVFVTPVANKSVLADEPEFETLMTWDHTTAASGNIIDDGRLELHEGYSDDPRTGLLPIDDDEKYNDVPSLKISYTGGQGGWYAQYNLSPKWNLLDFEDDVYFQVTAKGASGDENFMFGMKYWPDPGFIKEFTVTDSWAEYRFPISEAIDYFQNNDEDPTFIQLFRLSSGSGDQAMTIWLNDIKFVKALAPVDPTPAPIPIPEPREKVTEIWSMAMSYSYGGGNSDGGKLEFDPSPTAVLPIVQKDSRQSWLINVTGSAGWWFANIQMRPGFEEKHDFTPYLSNGYLQIVLKGENGGEKFVAGMDIGEPPAEKLVEVQAPVDWGTVRIPLSLLDAKGGDLSQADTFRFVNANNNPLKVWVSEISVVTVEPLDKISLTKEGDDFKLRIHDSDDNHDYQIWSYQRVGRTIFDELDEDVNQWKLEHSYILGGNPVFTKDGNDIIFNISDFDSVDDTYTVMVKEKDEHGDYVGHYKDTYTQAEVGEVAINRIYVDGDLFDGTFVADIADDSVELEIVTNIVEDVVYDGTDDATGLALAANINKLTWDISDKVPGHYTVTVRASNDATEAVKQVVFKLYDSSKTVNYAETEGLDVTHAVEDGYLNFNLSSDNPQNADAYVYNIGEPWRSAHYSSGKQASNSHTVNGVIPDDKYGYYQITSLLYREDGNVADDGAIRTVNHARDGGVSLDVDLSVDGEPFAVVAPTEIDRGSEVLFEASSDLDPAVFSFWRRDANGWVLVKDYGDGDLTWTPGRVGLYTFQIRVKADDGITYEALKNIEFKVVCPGENSASVTNIVINDTYLNANAQTRVPILIQTLNVDADTQSLLFKYIITNDFIYYVETSYTADPDYLWLPAKPGVYKISVLVKNENSFGKYDAIQTFTVTVSGVAVGH